MTLPDSKQIHVWNIAILLEYNDIWTAQRETPQDRDSCGIKYMLYQCRGHSGMDGLCPLSKIGLVKWTGDKRRILDSFLEIG